MNPSLLCGAEPAHPSLLFSAQDIPALREKVSQGWLQQAFAMMKVRADQYMSVATDPYPMIGPGNGGATAGRALHTRLSTLALTGLLTGDQRYLDKATSMVISAIQQTTVNDYVVWNDHLSVGDGAQAYAIAYDWLYPSMTAAQRTLLRDELIEFGQWLYTDSTGGNYYGNYSPTPLSCNHNSVMHGGMGLCALALGDRPLWVDRASKFIGGYFQYSLDTTGYSYEGMGYFGYGYWGAVPYAVAFKRSGGADLVLAEPKNGLVPRHTLHQLAPWGREVIAMNDSNARIDNSAGLMHLIATYQDRTGLWAWLKMFGDEGDKTYGVDLGGYLGSGGSLPYTILFADASLQPQAPDDAGIPINKVYSSGRGSYRTGWGPLDAMATFTSGFDQHRGHNHKDENSFTFFSRGEKFAIDPGYQPWETRSHNTIIVNGFGQQRNATEYDVYGRVLTTQTFGNIAWSMTGEAKDAFHLNVGMGKAIRRFLFVRANAPYLVIADDYATTSGAEADYAWLLHTDRANTMTVDSASQSAIIRGSKRGALCRVQLLSPASGLSLEQTDLTGQTFVARDVTYSYDKYFKELRATVRSTNPRFVAVIVAADTLAEFPLVRCEGPADNMTIRVGDDSQAPGAIIDTIQIAGGSITFSRQSFTRSALWPDEDRVLFDK